MRPDYRARVGAALLRRFHPARSRTICLDDPSGRLVPRCCSRRRKPRTTLARCGFSLEACKMWHSAKGAVAALLISAVGCGNVSADEIHLPKLLERTPSAHFVSRLERPGTEAGLL